MRLPLPRNRVVQLTLVGALLTAAVAVGLFVPGVFGDEGTPTTAASNLGADAPVPNASFTPAVEDSGSAAYEEHEEYGEEEEHEEEEHEEDEEHEEYGGVNAASGVDRSAATGRDQGGVGT